LHGLVDRLKGTDNPGIIADRVLGLARIEDQSAHTGKSVIMGFGCAQTVFFDRLEYDAKTCAFH
jgi:hypothetical protein